MKTKQKPNSQAQPEPEIAPAPSPEDAPRLTKKDQIIALFLGGITEVADLALITQARPNYVAGVLQDSGLLRGYFDLYTSSASPMNVYSKFFAKRLGYKDEATARSSVELIDRYHRHFELAEDRSGQHHALLMALTMFDRARWTGKEKEAEIFREWLVNQLQRPIPAASVRSAAGQRTKRT